MVVEMSTTHQPSKEHKIPNWTAQNKSKYSNNLSVNFFYYRTYQLLAIYKGC